MASRHTDSRPGRLFVILLIMTSRVMKYHTSSASIASVAGSGNAVDWHFGYARFESRLGQLS